MTKKEIFESGVDRGRYIASWQDLPEIGALIPAFTLPDFIGVIEDETDAEEVFMSLCWLCEERDREYTPFEFLAKELNEQERKKPYDVWNVFTNGVYKGFQEDWESRIDYYKD